MEAVEEVGRAMAELSTAEPPLLLDGLPADALIITATLLLAADLRAALRLSQASAALLARLGPVWQQAAARRLRWLPAMTAANMDISGDGRTLTQRGGIGRWAAGSLLPTVGRSSWKVRIDATYRNWGDIGIGVLHAEGRCGWVLGLYQGMLQRWGRGAGALMLPHPAPPPPAGFPDVHATRVMRDAAGEPAHLRGSANGAVIECILDHDAGSLAFSVNGGPRLHALSGFPAAAAMRLGMCLHAPDDRATLVTAYI